MKVDLYGPYTCVVTETQRRFCMSRLNRATLLSNDYHDIFAHVVTDIPPRGRLLLLGCGGGVTALQARTLRPDVSIIACDINPNTPGLAIEAYDFDLASECSFVCCDALEYVERVEATVLFDGVVVDLYGDGYVPSRFCSERFFTCISRIVKPGAIVAQNVFGVTTECIGDHIRERTPQAQLISNIGRSFGDLTLISPKTCPNTVVMAKSSLGELRGQRRRRGRAKDGALHSILQRWLRVMFDQSHYVMRSSACRHCSGETASDQGWRASFQQAFERSLHRACIQVEGGSAATVLRSFEQMQHGDYKRAAFTAAKALGMADPDAHVRLAPFWTRIVETSYDMHWATYNSPIEGLGRTIECALRRSDDVHTRACAALSGDLHKIDGNVNRALAAFEVAAVA